MQTTMRSSHVPPSKQKKVVFVLPREENASEEPCPTASATGMSTSQATVDPPIVWTPPRPGYASVTDSGAGTTPSVAKYAVHMVRLSKCMRASVKHVEVPLIRRIHDLRETMKSMAAQWPHVASKAQSSDSTNINASTCKDDTIVVLKRSVDGMAHDVALVGATCRESVRSLSHEVECVAQWMTESDAYTSSLDKRVKDQAATINILRGGIITLTAEQKKYNSEVEMLRNSLTAVKDEVVSLNAAHEKERQTLMSEREYWKRKWMKLKAKEEDEEGADARALARYAASDETEHKIDALELKCETQQLMDQTVTAKPRAPGGQGEAAMIPRMSEIPSMAPQTTRLRPAATATTSTVPATRFGTELVTSRARPIVRSTSTVIAATAGSTVIGRTRAKKNKITPLKTGTAPSSMKRSAPGREGVALDRPLWR